MGLFLQNGDDLEPLAMKSFAAEDALQGLLAKHPELLPGDEMADDEVALRFLLITREAPIKGFELDHLFIDQNAVPVLVEVKKADNRELRRQVVGQMLDYAANAASAWSVDLLTTKFAERCVEEGLDHEAELNALEHGFSNTSEFWEQVVVNLNAGLVRLVFLADGIPEELKSVVEFLNERMTPTSVFAVEVKQFAGEDGKNLLSSSLIGQTAAAAVTKGKQKQRPALAVLHEAGIIKPGDELWLVKSILPNELTKDLKDNDPKLKLKLVRVEGRSGTLSYKPSADAEASEFLASLATDRVRQALDPEYTTERARAVNDALALTPGGKSLGELAREEGLWTGGKAVPAPAPAPAPAQAEPIVATAAPATHLEPAPAAVIEPAPAQPAPAPGE